MRKLFLFVASLFIILNAAFAGDSTFVLKPAEIPIIDVVEKGLVKVSIRGAYGSGSFFEIIDRADGLHYGKCMAFQLRSNVDSVLFLKLDAGTLLIPTDTSVQKMLVTHDVLFPLYPRKHYWTRIYAMCSQIHNAAPSTGFVFSIGRKGDTNMVKLAKYLELSYNQNLAGQHAVWAYTDTAGVEELRQYGADSNSLKRSIEILNAVNIKTQLNKTDVEPEIIQKPAATITLESYIVYAGIGVIALLVFTSIAGLVSWNKNKRAVV